MSIAGTGLDIVETGRIRQSLEQFGERFIQRCFRPGEIAYCAPKPNPVPHYAARFAAKEAVSKAFGCGVGKTLGWLEMEVINDDLGAPHIVFHGGGLGLAEQRGVRQVFVSLTHTDQYAAASATLAG